MQRSEKFADYVHDLNDSSRVSKGSQTKNLGLTAGNGLSKIVAQLKDIAQQFAFHKKSTLTR